MRIANAKNLAKAGFTLSLVVSSGWASATSCPTCTATDAQPSNNPGLTAGVLTTTGLSTANIIGNTVGGIAGGAGTGGSFGSFAALPGGVTRFALPGQGGTGAAAAPGGKAFNAWLSLSQNNVDYEYAPLQSSGRVKVAIIGLDYTFSNNIVAGLAIAGDKTDVGLNGSSFGAGSNMTGRGTTYSPYIGIPINKNWTADASAGWGTTSVTTRVGGFTGSLDDDRTIGTVGLTYRQLAGDKWLLTGRGAYLYVKDKLGAYTMSNGTFLSNIQEASVSVSQLRLGGQAAYNLGSFIPYVGLNYVYDVKAPDQPGAANDRDAFQGVLGVKFSGASGLYGGFQYMSEQGRSQIKNNQFLLNIGSRF